jgi:hypothetical protein
VQGELDATRGQGQARLDVSDAARTLAWAQTLPGAAPPLAGLQAQGSATLQARWRGGWQDPELHARLSAPSLQAQRAQDAAPWQLQGAELTLDGRLAQAQAALRGALHQARASSSCRPRPSWPAPRPRPRWPRPAGACRCGSLQAQVRDPALGAGAWRLASPRPSRCSGGGARAAARRPARSR